MHCLWASTALMHGMQLSLPLWLRPSTHACVCDAVCVCRFKSGCRMHCRLRPSIDELWGLCWVPHKVLLSPQQHAFTHVQVH